MSANSNHSTPVTDFADALHEKFLSEHPGHVAAVPLVETPAPAHAHRAPHGDAASVPDAAQVPVNEVLADAAAQMESAVEAAPQPAKRRIRLSYGAGVALIAGGVAGVILPGIPGIPLLILGAAVLAPTVPALATADTWVQESFPDIYKEALDFADRFANDFEKRFPSEKPADQVDADVKKDA